MADMSWWPKHSTWERSGLNWGHWTRSDEEWFQGRLKLIRTGQAELRSSLQWKRALKYQKKTPKLVAANIQHSEIVLLQHLRPTL
jgi:hypothetical protein